jgi:hypothetical protein
MWSKTFTAIGKVAKFVNMDGVGGVRGKIKEIKYYFDEFMFFTALGEGDTTMGWNDTDGIHLFTTKLLLLIF